MAAVVWDEAIAFGGVVGTVSPPYWVSVSERVRDQASSSRGKQYEWDQQQAGTYSPTLINTDAALLPTNASSPYYPNVLPRRPYRKRFQYPATQQLLAQDQATAGEGTPYPAGTLAAIIACASDYDAACQIATSGSAWQGTQVLTATVPNAALSGGLIVYCNQWTIHPGTPHSYQVHVRVPAGAVNPQVAATIRWISVANTVLSDSTGSIVTITGGSASWITLTVTGTPPANAAGAACGVKLTTGGLSAFTMQVDGHQAELAAAPTTWTLPGVWGGVFNGWTDRLPQTYPSNGTYATATPTIVDSFARFGQIFPQPTFYGDVLALTPDFFYPLNDPTGSTVFSDLTGHYRPAPVDVSPYGPGSVTPGQSIQSTTAGMGFLGSPGPVTTFANIDGSPTNNFAAASWISLSDAGSTGPAIGQGFTKMVAFRLNAASANGRCALWHAATGTFYGPVGLPAAVQLYCNPATGAVDFVVSSGLDANSLTYASASNLVNDGNWHLMMLTVPASGLSVTLWLDGQVLTTQTSITNQVPAVITSDVLGVLVYTGVQKVYNGWQGDMADVAQWSKVLTNGQITALYQSWRNSWQGDTSGTRYARILGYAGYAGFQAVDSGATTDMGPATDIDGQTDAFTLLNNVVTTENGNHYVSSSGSVHFEARTRRYNQLVPVYTFGANTAAGEYPFADIAFDFDLDHVANITQITQQMSGQVFTASNAASIAAYDTFTLQRTINVVNPQECADAANYLVNRYDQPLLRINSITLNPARYPALWAVLAVLDISTRIRANFRTVGQAVNATPLVQFDGFVESIAWSVDASTGDDVVVLQVSPANLQLYWVLSALHTTVHTAGTAGTNTLVLNAFPDAASNPASASLCAGLQLTLEPGTANAETLTVSTFSATSPGYTTFTVTFTGNLAHNHAINTTVCEALTAGTTDPTTWDTASILGTSTTLAY